jgi:aryl-alcohol dehydrogenase-like predicted oxidoreductase
MIPLRKFGTTGTYVSALGLGGSHIGKVGSEREAIAIMRRAIELGVTFFDNAWEYEEGKSEERMGKALAGEWRSLVFLMTKCCTHGRDGKVAMKQLHQSLKRLKTDYLDLWQLHECVYYNDPERHFMKGGAAEALLKARQQGKVRFIGFTGHKDPAIHLKMLSYNFPFDSVQMPLNCFDASFKSFEQQVLPLVRERGIAPIGMKSLGGEAPAVKKRVVSAKEALRYAMSLPVAVTVSGIDSMKVLEQNVSVANNFKKMKGIEMAKLRTRMSKYATDGRFEYYKTTAKFDADEGRKQHGFPLMEEMAS